MAILQEAGILKADLLNVAQLIEHWLAMVTRFDSHGTHVYTDKNL